MTEFPPNPTDAETAGDAGANSSVDLENEPGIVSDSGVITGDRSFDLSLRVLTVLVLAALAGSVGLLSYRWLAPQLSQFASGPMPVPNTQPKPTPAKSSAGPAHGDEVLMDPRHVFRCEEQGQVTFSDRACTGSAAPGAAPNRSH